MVILKMLRGALPDITAEEAIENVRRALTGEYRPLARGTIAAQASILNVLAGQLQSHGSGAPGSYEPGPPLLDGEVFTNGRNLVAVSVTGVDDARAAILSAARGRRDERRSRRLSIDYIGPLEDAGVLDSLSEQLVLAGGIRAEPYAYTSEAFKELVGGGREGPAQANAGELAACEVLKDRAARSLALAVKTSGGLLVRDLEKQLPGELRDKVEPAQRALRDAGLVDSEIVVVCTKSQAQMARVASRELIEELTQKGLKCACGRKISEERIEEALTITELGRALLDKSRWLSLLTVEELVRVGVLREYILLEQQLGGDEIDCVAVISGELALFELKDKEFSLGNAYSFGAKIGIIRPQHPVIVTTEAVGGDAKDHLAVSRVVLKREVA